MEKTLTEALHAHGIAPGAFPQEFVSDLCLLIARASGTPGEQRLNARLVARAIAAARSRKPAARSLSSIAMANESLPAAAVLLMKIRGIGGGWGQAA